MKDDTESSLDDLDDQPESIYYFYLENDEIVTFEPSIEMLSGKNGSIGIRKTECRMLEELAKRKVTTRYGNYSVELLEGKFAENCKEPAHVISDILSTIRKKFAIVSGQNCKKLIVQISRMDAYRLTCLVKHQIVEQVVVTDDTGSFTLDLSEKYIFAQVQQIQ